MKSSKKWPISSGFGLREYGSLLLTFNFHNVVSDIKQDQLINKRTTEIGSDFGRFRMIDKLYLKIMENFNIYATYRNKFREFLLYRELAQHLFFRFGKEFYSIE